MTEYVVITLPKPAATNASTPAPPSLPIERVEATSATAAIRQVAEKKGSGSYVAVPARSWKPQTVTVEQTIKVTLGSAA